MPSLGRERHGDLSLIAAPVRASLRHLAIITAGAGFPGTLMAHIRGFCLQPVLYHRWEPRILCLLISMPASATEALPAANLPQGKVADFGRPVGRR